ncbi:MAG: hypothetical protein IIY21_26945 [Clostridiales bacterium]|nr:hypothetical protein [Clostridiales bacterium]
MTYIFPIAVFASVAVVLGLAMFTNFELDNYHYDRLKWIVERWHYFDVFVGVLVDALDMPYALQTLTIVVAFGAMLAGFLGISRKNWDGETVEYEEEE